MSRKWMVAVGLAGFTGVALGAFGAHALSPILPLQKVTLFETGVRYHLIHTFALWGVVLCMERLPGSSRALNRIAALFLCGIVLFSGSLYLLATSDWAMFGAITPFGGLAWLAGWAGLAWVYWKSPRPD